MKDKEMDEHQLEVSMRKMVVLMMKERTSF